MRVRLAILRLADSLPALVAEQHGLFSAAGLDVQLSVEPSWSNVADKLTFGALDAAFMLPPLALAAAAGLRGPRTRLYVPMALSEGGNSIVLGRDAATSLALAAIPADAARRFGAWIRAQPVPPRLAVVHAFSTHSLLLRGWLETCGVDPERDVKLAVIPPAEVVDALAAGRIAGFCAGAPWGDEAVLQGVGAVVRGAEAHRGRTEKCLAVAEPWASANAGALDALVGTLRTAGSLCASGRDTTGHAAMLAGSPLWLPPEATRYALQGENRPGFNPSELEGPPLVDMIWYADQFRHWGWLESHAGRLAEELCRKP